MGSDGQTIGHRWTGRLHALVVHSHPQKTPFETIPLGIPLEDLRDYAYETDPNAPQGEKPDATEKMATPLMSRPCRTNAWKS